MRDALNDPSIDWRICPITMWLKLRPKLVVTLRLYGGYQGGQIPPSTAIFIEPECTLENLNRQLAHAVMWQIVRMFSIRVIARFESRACSQLACKHIIINIERSGLIARMHHVVEWVYAHMHYAHGAQRTDDVQHISCKYFIRKHVQPTWNMGGITYYHILSSRCLNTKRHILVDCRRCPCNHAL